MSQKKSNRAVVDGWVVLDKPVGMTSTQAVSRLKRIYNAQKAGHAGTLDPLASGILPVAFGEATKTVPFVQDGEKAYRFTVRWGVETNSDDSDGEVTRTSETRPERAEIERLLPQFVGDIMQTPPQFSAIKIAGERAYDLAREGTQVDLKPRAVTIHSLTIEACTPGRDGFLHGMRQGRLCARHRARSGPADGLLRPCRGLAPHPRRAVSGRRLFHAR